MAQIKINVAADFINAALSYYVFASIAGAISDSILKFCSSTERKYEIHIQNVELKPSSKFIRMSAADMLVNFDLFLFFKSIKNFHASNFQTPCFELL